MPLDSKAINRNLMNSPSKNKKNSIDAENDNFEDPKYSFEDIVLTSNQWNEIKSAISYDKHKDLIMDKWGLGKVYPEKKGLLINLYGEPGTGKTMVAHAIARELKKRIILVNYAEIESKYVGETSKNLVELFKKAESNDAVLIFDEADALLSRRVTNMSSSTDVSVNQTKSVLLNILNDYSGVVIFTTNFISNYDYAFIRRIPFQIKFELPNLEQRKQIWMRYLSTGVPFSFDVDLISKKYENISGSDISNAVWMSALEAAEDGQNMITDKLIDYSIQRIIKTKNDNQSIPYTKITVRDVDEEYVKKQLGDK